MTARRPAARAPLPHALRLAAAACLTLALALGALAAAPPAEAATPAAEADAGATAATVVPAQHMEVKSKEMTDDPTQADRHPTASMRVMNPGDASRYVQIVLGNGQCLTEQWTYNNPGSWGDRIRDQIGQTCSAVNTRQQFMIAPLADEPVGTSDPGAHQFRIVSVTSGKCFFSRVNGLAGYGNMEAWDPRAANKPARGFIECGKDHYLRPNAIGVPDAVTEWIHPEAQSFGVYNDARDSTGVWQHWSWLVDRSFEQGAFDCANGNGATCLVRLPGSTEWLSPSDSAVVASGVQSERLLGCGSATTSGSPTWHNEGAAETTHTVSSSSTTSHSRTITDTHKTSVSASAKGGVKDVWEVGGSVSYEWGGSTATTESGSVTQEAEDEISVPGYGYFMYAWTGTVYTLEGDWRFGIRGADDGYISHVSSTYPASLGGEATQVVSPTVTTTKKSCFAGAKATNDVQPQLAASAEQCTAGTPEAPAATVGTVVVACPGEWDIPPVVDPDGSREPVWGYQWYYVDAEGEHIDIPGATRSSFVLQEESFLDAHRFLGVRVTELGDAYRLESLPEEAAASLNLHPAAATAAPAAAPRYVSASYVSELLSTEVGAPMNRTLIADADAAGTPASGTGVDLEIVTGALPSGMLLGPDGRIRGAALEAGEYAFTVRNLAGAREEVDFALVVHGEPADIAGGSPVDGVVGEALAADLATTVADGMDLVVTDGLLPDGLALDPATGRLEGTPTHVGTSVVTVTDQADPFAATHEVTIAVRSAPSQLAALPPAEATVGEPLFAEVAGSAGAGAVFGTLAEEADLGGLWVDAATGALAGTPTRAGEYAVTVTDITRADAPSEVYAVRVAEAPDDGGSDDADGGSGDAEGGTGDVDSGDAGADGGSGSVGTDGDAAAGGSDGAGEPAAADLRATGAEPSATTVPLAVAAGALLIAGLVALLLARARRRS
ncbi:Ig domain-containing protein [Microbacterium excoecariae]|uniref:Ig domain-containing protein n=1 Tax=Microbacterium excoecariae TaxID=2715210 RepID=UPI001407A765|nr:Ig domain-containing protein [Microbacterium excoecariae]NHI17999.1 hypothetical protein [Microbacterium excoecariae]